MLIYAIEKDMDIFLILREYFDSTTLEPFSNYIKSRISGIGMTSFMESIYKEATDKMKDILWG